MSTFRNIIRSVTQNIVVIAIALLIALSAACGSASNSTLAEKNTPQPTATFISIQVTVPPIETPTPGPIVDETPTTRGAPHPFAELLKTPENVTTGPLISGWQSYFDNGVMVFENNVWDFCTSGRGVATGDSLNGLTRWTLAPPRASLGLQANEITIAIWSPVEEKGHAGVLSFENDHPVLKPIKSFDQRSDEPVEYIGDPIPFEMHELTTCVRP